MSAQNDWQMAGNGAEIYDNIFVPAFIAEWSPKLIALADLKPGQRVLDIACGTGIVTRLAAQAVGPTGYVVGLDHSDEMLEVARSNTTSEPDSAPIVWRDGDAGKLPFDAESFDVVFCQLGLMFFPDCALALREMHRMLVPGGRIAVMTWGSLQKSPGQLAVKEAWDRHFGADKAALFFMQHSLGDPQQVSSMMREAAFEDASAQAVMGRMHFPSVELMVRSYGAMTSAEADEHTRSQIITEVADALKGYGEDGFPIEGILGSARKRP